MLSDLAKLYRWTAVGASFVMLVASGHYWNEKQVAPKLLFWFDFMLALFSVFLIVMLMTDVSEKRKNVNAGLLLIASSLSLAMVFS